MGNYVNLQNKLTYLGDEKLKPDRVTFDSNDFLIGCSNEVNRQYQP